MVKYNNCIVKYTITNDTITNIWKYIKKIYKFILNIFTINE